MESMIPIKLVDIANYYENNRIDGTNEGGVAYKLGELLDWRKNTSTEIPETENRW